MVEGTKRSQISGGRFDFEDGGTYCGGWDDGKAHGHGVCTGPKHQGAYAGAWNYGFEVSGAYIWPSGSHYEGQWQNGRRHGLGVEQIGRQIYRGEWSKDGHKGRYGIRESTVSTAKYEGTWNLGYQDGYGCETYADGGKYQGQWQEGKRHGYGIRTSAPFGLASHYRRKDIHLSQNSLRSSDNGEIEKNASRSEEIRGGFVLTARSDKLPVRRNSLTEKTKKGFLSGFKMRKQKSTGDLEKRGTIASNSIRSTASTSSWVSTGSEQSNFTTRSTHTDSNASFTMEDEQLDSAVVETYMGEWKKDKRCGHGVAERSDGLKYEGEWYNNKKHGYGVTTFRDGSFEEGKYKNNRLITSQKKKHLFLARSRKFRDRITIAVNSAQRALKMAMQRSDIAISRTSTAADRAQNADIAADQARVDCEVAVKMAREFAPDFKPSVLERFEKLRFRNQNKITTLGRNNISSPYSENMRKSYAGDRALQELNETDLGRHIQQEPEIQALRSMPVTPQTDFVNLINQQSHITTNSFTPMHNSQVQQNKQQARQYQDVSQNNNLNSNIGSNNLPFGARTTHNENNASYDRNTIQINQNNNNYGSNINEYKLDGYMYSDNEQRRGSSHFQKQTVPSQEYQQQKQVQSSGYPLTNSNTNHSHALAQQQYAARKHSRPHPLEETNQQLSIDYFDHYKRPPSRDSSTDRYARAASRVSENIGFSSRQPSVDRSAPLKAREMSIPSNGTRVREGSSFRGTPQPPSQTALHISNHGDNSKETERPLQSITGNLSNQSAFIAPKSTLPPINPPFEDFLLHQRSLGQDIVPSPMAPKRTESLYTASKPTAILGPSLNPYNSGGGKPFKSAPINVTLQRKKSLPDFQELPRATEAMSREEVSALGSARRETVRRQIQINERLKANPLLYIFSPQVKDWFSRQQLVLLVLFVNIMLGLLFVKMLA